MDWRELAPEVRAERAIRIVLVGSESSGKSTLVASLAEHYRSRGGVWEQTLWVPEYGREYTELLLAQQGAVEKDPDAPVHSAEWTAEDFAVIAVEQQRLEDAAAAAGSPVLFCDTDAFATRLWERRYLGDGSTAAFDAVPELPRRGLYLISDIDGVPFEQDGIRDGEDYREAMQRWFEEELTADEQPWALVGGVAEHRLAESIRLVDETLWTQFSSLPEEPQA
ncbi:nicotinamide riboside kinase [Salinibacterium sp. CAN_S4]|uniref:AAA family ATPase n=1 Tax=Salinibacterium sp. CAN_S4 TaxID=2787727 RepID=UPI0018EF7955